MLDFWIYVVKILWLGPATTIANNTYTLTSIILLTYLYHSRHGTIGYYYLYSIHVLLFH